MAKKWFFWNEAAVATTVNSPLTYDGTDARDIDGNVVDFNLLPDFTTGDAGKAVTVNDAETGYELTDVGGSGRFVVVGHFPQISQNTTEYVSLNSETAGVGSSGSDPTDVANTAEQFCWIPSFTGSLKYAYGRVNLAPAAGQTFTLTVMKNGAATDLVVTFTDAGITANNTTDSVAFVAGDRLAWQVTTSATSGNFKGSVGLGVEIPAGEAGTRVKETPTGTINGSNTAFTVSAAPASDTSFDLFKNGLLLTLTDDYTRTGTAITMVSAPLTGSKLTAIFYT